MRYLLLTGLLLSAGVVAQDMPEVSNTIQKFVENNDLSQLEESCPSYEACSDYHYHGKTYVFKGEARQAFERLVSLKPNQLWDGTSRFEMEYDPESHRFIGKNEVLPDVKIGQVFFLELSIALGLKIPVAFKVVELDRQNLTLSFSYLKQNKSKGIQRISFTQKNEEIHILHETRFRSDSRFRDNNLYGPFHELLLNDFYQGFKEKLQ